MAGTKFAYGQVSLNSVLPKKKPKLLKKKRLTKWPKKYIALGKFHKILSGLEQAQIAKNKATIAYGQVSLNSVLPT